MRNQIEAAAVHVKEEVVPYAVHDLSVRAAGRMQRKTHSNIRAALGVVVEDHTWPVEAHLIPDVEALAFHEEHGVL